MKTFIKGVIIGTITAILSLTAYYGWASGGVVVEQIPPRWLQPYYGYGPATTAATGTEKVMHAMLFNVSSPVIVDQICTISGSATTTAGQYIMGIYGPVVTQDTMTGSPLIARTATSASPTAANTAFCGSVSAHLSPGEYYVVFMNGATSSPTYVRHGNQTQIVGWTQTYTTTNDAIDLPAIAPSMTNNPSNFPNLRLRVVKP